MSTVSQGVKVNLNLCKTYTNLLVLLQNWTFVFPVKHFPAVFCPFFTTALWPQQILAATVSFLSESQGQTEGKETQPGPLSGLGIKACQSHDTQSLIDREKPRSGACGGTLPRGPHRACSKRRRRRGKRGQTVSVRFIFRTERTEGKER